MSGQDFSAAESALGYLYQCRLALFLFLRRVREEPVTTISIEKLDDIVFEKDGKPVELLQAKHHVQATGSLSDASVDLWKTIRIWIDAAKKQAILLPGAILSIVTTNKASEGSAASFLRAKGRSPEKALALLKSIPSTSSNKENAAAYKAFEALDETEKTLLIEAIFVLDGALTIDKIEAALESELRFIAPTEHLASLRARLEGWWFGRTIRHLLGSDSQCISGEELDVNISDLREQFKLDNLPIDPDVANLGMDAAPESHERAFVHQLKLIGVSNKRITSAILDYYRAFEQRSRWLREDLLLAGELERYEETLCEEWERHFNAMEDRLGSDATEDRKCEAARLLYEWAELEASFHIRPRCQAPFVMRGSFHSLADDLKVGWHPDFLDRLRQVLGLAEKSA